MFLSRRAVQLRTSLRQFPQSPSAFESQFQWRCFKQNSSFVKRGFGGHTFGRTGSSIALGGVAYCAFFPPATDPFGFPSNDPSGPFESLNREFGFARHFYERENNEAAGLILKSSIGFWAFVRLARLFGRGQPVLNFVISNAAASAAGLRQGKLHTLFTASLTHVSFLHLLMNVLAFDVLYRSMKGALSNTDMWQLFSVSSIMSIGFHTLSSPLPVMGLSGVVMAMGVVTAAVNPRETFTMLFPVPGLMLTTLQVADVFFFFNLLMASRRGLIPRGVFSSSSSVPSPEKPFFVAWHGHLFGLIAGGLFVEWKRLVEGRRDVKDLAELHYRYFLGDWKNSFADFGDSWRAFQLRRKIDESSVGLERRKLQQELEEIEMRKRCRRQHAHEPR
uniref:Peptidase S54 rhomboid domain-containing protein n=1 Tax=Chromera velia CCMP2878 TaxID=1169474 RepID=A0A0G4IEP0_9ALVE|eukprot:Cvel_13706.t1-p1 / transcript=Cvel_13706.t1 / gene=Cvel_13706 / organism=Chromera_velia_CCMP2878 / gene_product=Rhomboid-like protease 6, putative / transcript_product=Rhomboid-like protease 6, putative / location=Cvel_scaffold947:33456-34622(-) / protein_length=389 / sequence_SO=supercontig / SO=protein_coding / is_pseudo=false